MTDVDHSPALDDHALAYQQLQPDDILAAAERLGYRTDGHLLALNSYENRVYRVGLEDSAPIVIKFYRPGRWTDEAILEEHEFALELAGEAEVPVVPPLVHDGRTLHHSGAFRYSVFPTRGGRPPDLDDMKLLRQLGRFVARIHLQGERKSFIHRPTLNPGSYGVASRDFLMKAGFIPGHLHAAYTSLCGHLFEVVGECYEQADHPRMLRIHADCHPGNILVVDEDIHIVDLDDARTGPAVQDLWMFVSGDRNEQTPQLAELLGGYTEFRSFSAPELHLIEALRTLRIMHYAAWLARRWEDPAFKIAFPWFNTNRYWEEHILALKEQLSLMQEPPLVWDRG